MRNIKHTTPGRFAALTILVSVFFGSSAFANDWVALRICGTYIVQTLNNREQSLIQDQKTGTTFSIFATTIQTSELLSSLIPGYDICVVGSFKLTKPMEGVALEKVE